MAGLMWKVPVFANSVNFRLFSFRLLDVVFFYVTGLSVVNVAEVTQYSSARRGSTGYPQHGALTRALFYLWTVLLAVWGLCVALFSKHLPQEVMARVIGVMGLISVGLTLFMLLTSDHFRTPVSCGLGRPRPKPAPFKTGNGFHPPLLYMGYVRNGGSFCFCGGCSYRRRRLDAAWARWTRPWTSIAWIFLTLGIALGSWWAYYELGWGGWWFWDPVENAAFMPWLYWYSFCFILWRLLKSVEALKIWTVLLALIAFSLFPCSEPS